MDEQLLDLYDHQAWADAELWRATRAHPEALEDKVWFERQHHIHMVQRAFLSILQGLEVVVTEPADFTPESLREDAHRYHDEIATYLRELPVASLEERLTLPWFREPPIRINRRQTLMQTVMHSQHHRGQNATRLRELGGEPQTMDLIFWYWKERPAPVWSVAEAAGTS